MRYEFHLMPEILLLVEDYTILAVKEEDLAVEDLRRIKVCQENTIYIIYATPLIRRTLNTKH